MTSRGGRGGTRRGGRGYTPPSGAQLYLKRSAQEAGLDDRNLRNLQDITKPDALFPSLKWHSNGTIWNEEEDDDDMDVAATSTKRSASTVYLIQKGRDMRSRMKALYQVRPKQEQDVLRYHTKDQKNTDTSPSIAAKRLGHLYVPQELLPTAAKKQKIDASSPAKRTATADTKGRATNLTELEEIERKRRSEEEKEEDVALLDQSFEQSDEEDEAADYTMNYYESEDDDSNMGGGDGGEPTF